MTVGCLDQFNYCLTFWGNSTRRERRPVNLTSHDLSLDIRSIAEFDKRAQIGEPDSDDGFQFQDIIESRHALT